MLVRADGKDRLALCYMADMLRLDLMRTPYTKLEEAPPRLADLLIRQKKPAMTAKKAESFVDTIIHTFGGKGGKK